jgi:PleD family two-component response regulator
MFVPYETPPSIEKDINNYIDKIGRYTEELEDSFNNNDIKAFISTLEAIQKMLQAVYATQCESHVLALLRAARTHGIDYCQKLLQQAIADFTLLSIEMQKAQNLGTSTAPKYRNIEKNEETVRSLSAISRLINTGDYEKAQRIINEMKSVDDTFVKLNTMFAAREYDRALETAQVMEKEHISHITKASSVKTHKTILAVDDRPEILSSVNAALRNHFKVLGAPNGRVALEIMAQQKIDLFFLDIDMPEMDGFELTQRIRRDATYKNTPIIFLTGYASREHILRATNLGISDFIVKPAYNVTLLASARRYIE